MAKDVFISYSSHDGRIAEAVCAALEAKGASCWMAPRDITPAATWSEAIIDGLDGCRIMVLVFSSHSNLSPQVLREVERTVHKNKLLLPLRIEDVVPTRALEYFVSSSQWLDAITPPVEPHLQRLAEAVLRLLSGPEGSEKPESAAASAGNLPQQTTHFIGRAKELQEIRDLLKTARLLSLIGAGGSGKTRLSLQAGAGLSGEYRDGIWLVEFASLSDPALVPQTVAEELGVREEPGRVLVKTLADHLKPKAALLILDNCEHLLQSCAHLVDSLLKACPDLRVLATSQERLGIAGETTYRVPPLSLPGGGIVFSMESLMSYEAVRLFADRAAAARPGFVLTDSEAPTVARICRRLDGIPLAIELTAARVKAMSLQQIAERLEDRFRLLTGGSRMAVAHHQTLRASMDWSYDLLTEAEKTLLQRVSVFAGGWTLEAAEAIAANPDEGRKPSPKDEPAHLLQPSSFSLHPFDILDLLSQLVDKSLVTYEEERGSGRYRMLETVRQYSKDRLMEAGESEVEGMQRRHLDFFLSFAGAAAPSLLGPEQMVWLEQLDAEHDNLRAALEWCRTGKGDVRAGLQLAGDLWLFWFLRGYLREGSEHLTAVLQRAGASDYPGAQAGALTGAGVFCYFQGEIDRAHALCEQSLPLARQEQDTWLVALNLVVLGVLAYYRSDFGEATTLLEESVTLSQQLGDPWLKAVALSALGFVAFHQGDLVRAQALCEESLECARGVRENWCVFNSLYSLGLVTLLQNNYPHARSLFKEALTLSRSLGHVVSIALCLEGLAGVWTMEGDVGRAALLMGAAKARRNLLGVDVPPAFRAGYDHILGAVQAALGETAFEAAWAQGLNMNLAQAVEYALDEP